MKKDLKLKDGRILDGRFNEGLFEENWFHGEVSCDEAEARLSLHDRAGSFLVRNVGSLYIFSVVGKIQNKVSIKHLKVPYTRKHGLLKENPGLKTEYEVIRHILSSGCKYFLQTTDFKNIKIEKEEKESLKCKICEKNAKSIGDSHQHQQQHTFGFCPRCKGLTLVTNYAHHRRTCDPDFILRCETCSKYETKCPKSLNFHKKKCQALYLSPFKCSSCDEPFITEKKLHIHEIKVHKKRVLCDLCGMSLNKKSIYMHKQIVHKLDVIKSKNKSRYQCPKCDFKTPFQKYIEHHMNFKHKEDKHKYQCDACSFSTRYKLEMKKHNAQFHKYLIPIKEKKSEKIVIIGF